MTMLTIHPADSAFVAGELMMPLDGTLQTAADALRWGDYIINSSLVVAFVVLMMLNLRNFISIIPALIDSAWRWKGSVNLDSSIKLASARNLTALILTIPCCLVASRYHLVDVDIFGEMSATRYTLWAAALLLAYTLLRHICFVLTSLRARKLELFTAAHHASYNFFIILSILLLVEVGILSVTGVSDANIKIVMTVIAGLVYLVYLTRKSQIFNSYCSPLTTFLYLCALEFLPTGALIAAIMLL